MCNVVLNKNTVAWILGKQKKPFTDTEMVRESMSEVFEALLDGKQKDKTDPIARFHSN